MNRFFFGVIGWTPEVTYRQASLNELADAYEGYLEAEGLLPQAVNISRAFLDRMMTAHPDEQERSRT